MEARRSKFCAFFLLGGQSHKLMVKGAMFILPLIFIVVGYFIYWKKYKISEEFYGEMLKDLEKQA